MGKGGLICLAKGVCHPHQRLLMGAVYQMGVNSACGGGGGVSKGFSDVKQGSALGAGDSGEGVTQSVKRQCGQLVVLDKAGEGQGKKIGGVGLVFAVENDIPLSAAAAVRQGLLAKLFPAKKSRYLVRQKEGAGGRAVFCLFFDNGGAIGTLAQRTWSMRRSKSMHSQRRPQISSRRSPMLPARCAVSSSGWPSSKR